MINLEAASLQFYRTAILQDSNSYRTPASGCFFLFRSNNTLGRRIVAYLSALAHIALVLLLKIIDLYLIKNYWVLQVKKRACK